MSKVTIDQVIQAASRNLDLSSETEQELLSEIRTHLEDAVADARSGGLDEESALLNAAERFGVEESAAELRQVHLPWESADAIIACALPVLAALVLRWLIFAPDGSAVGWPQLLLRPAFWVVALAALLVPFIQFRQWRYALVGWGVFWALSIMFMALPTIGRW